MENESRLISKSIPHLFFTQAEHYGTRVFLRVKRDGHYRDISWKALAEDVYRLAAWLKKQGVKRGDAIALLSENRPEWVLVDLATLSLGATLVPIYATSTGREIAYVLNHSEAEALFVSTPAQCSKISSIEKEMRIRHVIGFDGAPDASVFTATLKEVLSEVGVADALDEITGIWKTIKRNDLASIIYTSGTTGPPKGVMLTHGNFLSNCEACKTVIPIGETDECLSFLPLSHVFERMAGYYYPLYCGATISYAERMDTVPDNLMEIRPTICCSVPRLYEKIYTKIMEQGRNGTPLKKKLFKWCLKNAAYVAQRKLARKKIAFSQGWKAALALRLVGKKVQAKLGGRLKFFISGGAPLSKEIAEFFFSMGVLILEGYGLTETSPVITCNSPDAFRLGTVGRAIPDVRIKIASDGEILSAGPHIMPGYFKDRVATNEVIQGGWFHTGDVGEIDADGFLSITDRKKDIIVTAGGKNIAPQNIEQTLISDAYISQVCVIGDRRPHLVALIVPDWAAVETFARAEELVFSNRTQLAAALKIQTLIRARIDERMKDFPPYASIKHFALLPEEFSQAAGELTPTLKVKRKAVIQKYASLIDHLYQLPR